VAEKHRQKKIELHYSFDRLATQKLLYVYQILVPIKKADKAKEDPDLVLIGGMRSENSSDLRTSVLRTPERRTNNPKPDRNST
jgi:hypothetical protein